MRISHKIFLALSFFMISFFSQKVKAQMVINATGPSNAFSVTYPANISTLSNGLSLTFFSNQSITGPASLNVNGTGPRSIVKNGNQPLTVGEIKSGQAVTVIFDGVNWQMTSSLSPSTGTGFWTTSGNTSDSTANYIGTNNNQPLIMSTNGTERMRISRAGRFGFNMNPTAGSMFNIKSLGSGAILSVIRSTDAGALIDLTETGGGNARIDMYNAALGNVVQIPSGPGNIFFAGGGNMGVNTTAPGNTFHVLGGARISNLSTSGAVFSNPFGDLYVNTTLGNVGSATANQLAYYTTDNSITGSNLMTWNQTAVGFNIGESNDISSVGKVGLFTLGTSNTASGFYSFAIGSRNNAEGNRSYALGNYVNALHVGSFLIGDWSGSSPAYTASSGSDEFTARFSSGYRFFTKSDLSDGVFMNQNGLGIGVSNPQNKLDVMGGARIANLSTSGAVFANTLGDLYISTISSNFWTVSGTNLQPLNNTLSLNLATTFGGYYVNGNRIVSSNSANVVFLGNAGSAFNAGSNNLFFGVLAGGANTSGNSNIFMGFQSGAANITGTQNVYLGEFSGLSATGSNNIFLGQNAGRNTTSAFNNIFLGSSAGSNNLTGGANIVIGALANVSLSGLSNAIAIGMNSTVGGSNMMALGGTGGAAVKVGIGTGMPQNDLHVVGGARITNLSTSGAVFADANGDLFVSTSSGASAWTVSGSNIFPQNLQTNVGIGLGTISTPGLVTGASRYLTLAANQTNTFGYPSFEMLSINTSTANTPMSRMDFVNVITPFSTRSNHARIAAFTGKSVLGHGQLGFYTSNGTLNEVMRLSENAGMSIGITYAPLVPPIHGLIVQGNVGIGTSVPGNNLHVAGGVRVSNLAGSGPVFANTIGDLFLNTVTGISGAGTTGGVAFWNTNNTLTANGANLFWNNTTERLGIGNSNPQSVLHISSDNTNNSENLILDAAESSASRGPGIAMLRAKGTLVAPTAVVSGDYLGSIVANGRTATQYNRSASINFEVDAAVSGTFVPGRIVFSTTSSTGASTEAERMRINSNGNVGIGISTPLARLHVRGSGNTAATDAFTIQNSVNTILVNVQNDGFVGIGTSTPASPLHVVGDARFFGPASGVVYSVNLYSGTSSGPRIAFSDASSLNAYMEIGSYGGDNNIDNKTRDFRIYSNATSAAGFNILATNGRVGIGTLTPLQILHVQGNICYTGTSAACSDINYKTDIVNLTAVLPSLKSIRGVYYYWKVKDFPEYKFDSTRQIGVIAQEVEKVFPELVITNDNGYKTVDYPKLSPILLQAIKEQQLEIDSLKQSNLNQDLQLQQLKSSLDQKEMDLKELKSSSQTQQKQLELIHSELEELKRRVMGEAKK